MEEGVLWSRSFIPMDPDKIPLAPEAARLLCLHFPKANFGRIGLDAGDPQSFPGPPGTVWILKMLPNLFQAMGKEEAKERRSKCELLSLICDIYG